MTTNRKRNQQILQMRAQGVARREVARQFGITPGGIGVIEQKAGAEQSLAERRARLRADLRDADDLDKRWLAHFG